jgi:Tfp pilus assembly protein FimT
MSRPLSTRLLKEVGMTLIDQLATLAIIGTVAGIAVPGMLHAVENQRLGIEARNVERELQTARLAAVTNNQPIRVRFNCPAAGQYRRVELIGTVTTPAADDANGRAAARCSTATYPYPAADRNRLTRPNNDGPLSQLNPSVTFQNPQTLEFWPDGTAHVSSTTNPWPQIGATPVGITLKRGTTTRVVTVNGLGKIQLQ